MSGLAIYCERCKDYRDASHKHSAGFSGKRPVTASKPEPEPYDPDTYTPPWRRGTVSMGDGQGTPPSYNTHMRQVQPRNNKRNPALDQPREEKQTKRPNFLR